MTCILMDRLYVPENHVTQEHLELFTHTFSEDDFETEYSDEYGRKITFNRNPFKEIKTYNKIKDPNSNKVYYGFSRGDIQKIGALFGHLDWEDHTSAPPMISNLQFKSDKRLFTYEKDGIGQEEAVKQWLKVKGGIIRGAPRFGKTVSAVYIATNLRLKTLIVAHQKDLLDQFFQEFIDFTNYEELVADLDFKKKDATGRIVGFFNEFDNPEELDVCFLCWQTFASKYGPERILNHKNAWGLHITDECLDENTLIATLEGHKKLKNIEIGEEVRTPKGTAKVINKWTTEADAYEYLLESKNSIIASENHLVSSLVCNERYRFSAAKRKVKKIGQCTNIEKFRNMELEYKEVNPLEHFIGWHIADGTIEPNKLLKFRFRKIDKVNALSELSLKLNIPFTKSQNKRGDYVLYYGLNGGKLLLNYGFPTGKKSNIVKIPEEFFNSCSKGVIKGIFDGDASINDCGIEWNTASKELCRQVMSILLSLSISPTYKEIPSKNKEHSTMHRLTLYGESALQYNRLIGFSVKYKQESLNKLFENFENRKHRRWKVKDEIIDKKYLGKRTLIDIELDDEDKLFIANGLVVHNCHRCGGIQYATTVNKLNPRHRLGLTGTVERVDEREVIYEDIIGPVVAEGKVKEVPCKVTIIRTGVKIDYEFGEPLPYLHKRLYNNKERMDILLHFLQQDVRDGKFICFAFHRCSVAQLQKFTEKLQDLGFRAESFYGTMKKNRKEVLNEFRSGEIQIAVCNTSMLTGINVPRWDCFYSAFPDSNVVFNETGKLSGEFLQKFSRGRTIFKYEDGRIKEYCLIRDFSDNNKFCYGSLGKRLKAYKSQKFDISYINIKTKKEKLTDGI